MARDHARIYLSIWESTDFTGLTISEQWTYFALISSPDLSWCGVAPLLPQRLSMLARDAGAAKVSRALTGLDAAGFIIIDPDTAEIAVRTFVRHDGVMKQPNVLCAAIKAWDKVHSATIRSAIRGEFARAYAEGFPEGFREGFGKAFAKSFPKGFPEGFANSPSPFPLPPSFSGYESLNGQVSDARVAHDLTLDGATR